MIDRLPLPIELPYDALAEFCRRWKITKMEVFGSILRDDFGSESDVDFLVTFDPEMKLTLLNLVQAEDELSRVMGRRVDLVDRLGIEQSENWIRRKTILGSAKTIYVG